MQDCCCRKHSLAYPFVIFFPTSSSLVNNTDLLKERAAAQDWHYSHAYRQTMTFLFAELKPIYLPSQFHLKASCFRNLAWSAQQPRSPSREIFLLLRRRTRSRVYRLPAPLYRPRMAKETRAILRGRRRTAVPLGPRSKPLLTRMAPRCPPLLGPGTHLLPAGGIHAPCCPGAGAVWAAPTGPGAAVPPPAPRGCRCTGRRAAACAPRPCPAAAAGPAAAPGRSHLPRLSPGRPVLLPWQGDAAARPSEPSARLPAADTGSPSPGTGTAPSGSMPPSYFSDPAARAPQSLSSRLPRPAGRQARPRPPAKFASARCKPRRPRAQMGTR